MTNLISAENYKLKKDQTLLILGLVVAGWSIIMALLFKVFSAEVTTDKILFGLANEGQHMPFLVPSFASLITVCLAIFAGIFVSQEFSGGCIRNVIGMNRTKYYFIKLYSQLLAGVCLLILTTFFLTLTFVLCVITWGNTPDMNYFLHLVLIMFDQIVILLSFSSVFTMISFMLRNSGATVGVCIGITLVENILAQLFGQIRIPLLNTIAQYMPSSLMNSLSALYLEAKPVDAYFTLLPIPVIIIMISTAIGIVYFKKKDI